MRYLRDIKQKSALKPMLLMLTLSPVSEVIAQAGKANEVEEELIVVGTPGAAGIDKKDVSFSVTALGAGDIERFSPKSTADLFKAVPGVWAESSGGVAGANIDVRGLPGGSDAPFVTLTLNGSPLYGTQTLSFFEQSSIFRIDETISTVEGLRGGPGAVFGPGEPGLTVNFNLKRGQEETEGRVKYTTSDYDLQRFDGVLSGKLAEDTYYLIGGYVSESPGIRDTQFTAERGEQFTINLTREFENGEVSVFTRVTDDHGQWVVPFALGTGLDAGTFTPLGNATRFREIQISANGDTEVFDFARGRGWDGSVSGATIEFDLGDGWTFRDNIGFTKGDANTFGFLADGSPVSVADVRAQIGGAPVTTTGGVTLDDDDFVQSYGHWVVFKELRSFVNDLSFNKNFNDEHDVTFGIYQNSFSSTDFWSIANPIAVHNAPNGDTLANVTTANIAAAGGGNPGPFGLSAGGDAQITAFYLADSWQFTDVWRLDLGVRHESLDIEYVADINTEGGFPDGTRDVTQSISDEEVAFTAGLNWDVSDTTGLFARYSDGFAFPGFNDIRDGNFQINDIEQYELGFKYRNGFLDVFATAFFNESGASNNVVGGTNSSVFETEATGIELDATAHLGEFNIKLSGVIQDAEVTDSTTVSDIGNKVLRQPDFQFRIEPSYDFTVGSFTGTLYAAATFIDDRFGDTANDVVLPSYEKFDLGLQLQSESGVFFQIHGDNLNDSDGITEGDPRNASAPNGRPIFGRSVRFSVGYDFSS